MPVTVVVAAPGVVMVLTGPASCDHSTVGVGPSGSPTTAESVI